MSKEKPAFRVKSCRKTDIQCRSKYKKGVNLIRKRGKPNSQKKTALFFLLYKRLKKNLFLF